MTSDQEPVCCNRSIVLAALCGSTVSDREGRKAQLTQFIDALEVLVSYDEGAGFFYWELPDDNWRDCGTCTNGARLVVQRFGGRIMGYADGEKIGAIVGDGGGHDFAITPDGFLVDYWGKHYEESSAGVYDLHDAKDSLEVERLYGKGCDWKETIILKFK